jgi:hypothetical protein
MRRHGVVELDDRARACGCADRGGLEGCRQLYTQCGGCWAHHKQQQEKLKMEYPEIIRVELELPDPEALALAELVKRITWKAMRECSANEDECYRIRSAVEKLRRALAGAGYAPR